MMIAGTEDLGRLFCAWCDKEIVMTDGGIKLSPLPDTTKMYHKKECFDAAKEAEDRKKVSDK